MSARALLLLLHGHAVAGGGGAGSSAGVTKVLTGPIELSVHTAGVRL